MIVNSIIGICLLIGLILLVALFVKKDYAIERSIVINRKKPDVFAFIKQVKNHDQFSKWIMADPDMKKVYHGTDGTVGFVYAWDGNKKAGKGEQEIKGIKEGELLALEVRFIKPFEGIAQSEMNTVAQSDHTTRLTWMFSSEMKYPMNIMRLFINMDNMLGRDMELSLHNLKVLLEK